MQLSPKSTEPARAPASSGRPFPLRARADLVVRPASYQGDRYWLVKDPVALEYHRLHPVQHKVLQLLDGVRSLEQVRDETLLEFPTQRMALHELQQLAADFHVKGLVVSDRPGQGTALFERARTARFRRIRQVLENILYIRLPGWDPERTLARLDPFARWMFRPAGLVLCLALIAAAWTLLAVKAGELERELPTMAQFFYWRNLFWLWITLGTAKILHELGHGLACRAAGGECHEIGVAFLVFSPCLYCDVSDSWMLPDKSRRILIAAAGMYVECLISAVAVLVWWMTHGGLLHFLALQTFLVTMFTTVVLNANPLLQFDGYFILSDLLEIPNLRAKADRLCARFAARVCLGLKLPDDPFMPERGKGWFVSYSLASLVYRLSLLFSISLVLYQVLRPFGLQMLAPLSASAILVRMALNATRLLTAHGGQPMSPIRTAASLATAAAGVCALLYVPIPLRPELPFTVAPRGVQHVYASSPGRLVKICTAPGERVERGQVLVELCNFSLEEHLSRLKTALKVQENELSVQRRLNDAAGARIAGELSARLEEQIEDCEQQMTRLKVVAPCRGTVVAPPVVREPQADATGRQPLPQWHGTPLERGNLGAWIETGAHLVSVAPASRCDAHVVIEQNQRNDVEVGGTVELKCDCRPDRSWTGKIVAIGDRHVERVADALSSKYAGPVPTVTGPDGHERLLSGAFEGVVELPDSAPPLLPGMRGQARVNGYRRTAAQWLWRHLNTTLHFRL